MPTIHIHTDDHSVVLDVIATLLQWDALTITIDQRDEHIARSWDEIARRDVDQRAAEAAQAAVELAARAASDQPHPIVLTIGEQERRNLLDTWTVPCPKCKADPGRPCHAPGGESYGNTFVHNGRRHALQAARRITLDEV